MNIALIVLVYIVAVVILLNPWSRRGALKTRTRKHPASAPYRAISLACDAESCQEMAVMGGRRFLIDEAPDIPLQQCATGSCGSRYVHHHDRRSSSDRRVDSSRTHESGVAERRGVRGRRRSDWSLLAVSG